MKRQSQCVAFLLLIVGAGRTVAQATEPETYRVQVAVHAGDDEGTVAKAVAATYGGRLESATDADHTVLMIIDGAMLHLIERDARVRRVERAQTLAGTLRPPGVAGIVADPAVARPRLQTEGTATPWTTGNYQYDPAGNITQIGADRFVYDVYSRIKSGTAGGQSQEYAYDRYGNLTSVKTGTTTIPLTVDPATNRLSAVNGSSVSYDAAGQALQTATAVYTYDGGGMMTSALSSVQPSNLYIYTPGDERIASVVVNGGVEVSSSWTFRDTSGRVLRRLDRQQQSGQWTWVWRQDYIYNGEQMLASENDTIPTTRHYFADHLGSPRLTTDGGGMLIGFAVYLPFGAQGQASGVSDTKKFTGHERDASGLDYMHARYYNWGWGRFLSVDPSMDLKKTMANPQMWNRYSYVVDNPVRYTDPDGREHVNEPGFTKPMTAENLAMDENTPAVIKGAFYAEGALLGLAAEEFGGAVYGTVRGLTRLARGAREDPTLRPDVKVSGGRSGQDVKTTTGPPKSVVRGSDGRIYQTNDKGQIIKDITKDRVKPVTPGQGFGPKRPPTAQELSWLEKMAQAIRDLVK